MKESKNIICSICGAKINSIYESHNAQPINNGRCCSICNDFKVIPTRLERFSKGENIYEVKKESSDTKNN